MSAVPYQESRPNSLSASRASSRQHSRRGSCSTFSTNLGVARSLNERGISSAGSIASESPPVTPCNSPEHPQTPPESPPETREPFFSAFKLPGELLLVVGMLVVHVFL